MVEDLIWGFAIGFVTVSIASILVGVISWFLGLLRRGL